MRMGILADRKRLLSIAKTIRECIIEIICTICLVYMLVYFCDMGNTLFQTLKNIWAAKAIFMLVLFMFFTQRPRLLNWQSLAATLLYLPGAYVYRNRYYPESPDLFAVDKVVVWIVWLLILIAVDMAVYKKVTHISFFNKKALVLWGIMTTAMVYYRNGRPYPLILLLMCIFYLIPLDRKGWGRVVNQVCNAWMVTFFIILYRSITENPEVGAAAAGRWYGNFLNIGDFGRFMGCTVAVLVFRLYQIHKMKGWWKLLYIACAALLVPIGWTLLRVSTITMYIGLFLILVMCFIVLTRRGTGLASGIRLVIALAAIGGLGYFGFEKLHEISQMEQEHWEVILGSTNPLMKPFSELIRRAYHMFSEGITYAEGHVFEPGSLISQLDLFTSGRLSICAQFMKEFRFEGNESFGIQVGTYWAYNAHNAYIQILFEYGYIGGGAFILWLFYNTIAGAVRYVKDKKPERFLVCVWMAMVLGVLTGEMVNLYDFSIVTAMILTYPVMINLPESLSKAREGSSHHAAGEDSEMSEDFETILDDIEILEYDELGGESE